MSSRSDGKRDNRCCESRHGRDQNPDSNYEQLSREAGSFFQLCDGLGQPLKDPSAKLVERPRHGGNIRPTTSLA
jgi:hypothetical protein